MLKQAMSLWRTQRHRSGTTLQRRLILFFISVAVFIILAFLLLLMLFGINGRGEKAVRNYMENELSHLSGSVEDDFGRLSLLGVKMSDSISSACEHFFEEAHITAGELSAHSELLTPLIDAQIPYLTTAMNSNICSGAFLLLDATVKADGPHAENAHAGFYMRAMQPLMVQTVGPKYYCLRGPAQVARDHGIELLGQWQMEYDITGEDFFQQVMDTAQENTSLPLSRLYYWTGRIVLHGNSESSFLLCVPLRSADGTVFGVCGVEVSDRMFKQLYTPKQSNYENVFAAATIFDTDALRLSQGMIAGNAWLTGQHMAKDLGNTGEKSGFDYFGDNNTAYGGLSEQIKIYPDGSAYEDEKWVVAVLMPQTVLDAAIKGNSAYLFWIVGIVMMLSLMVSLHISRRYLYPVKQAIASIRNKENTGNVDMPYLEITDLFDFLAAEDRQYEEEKRRLKAAHRGALSEAEAARQQAAWLADRKRCEIDPESYALFCEKIRSLTPREREVFALYLDGKSAKEIVALLGFSENALKYHNKNIYSKLGVSSRKELLMYAALMKEDAKRHDK